MALYIILLLIFSLAGVLLTLYLISHVRTGKPVKAICLPREWCDKVQFSKYNKTLGIPNAMIGFVMYLAIFALTLFYINGSVSFLPIQIIVAFGFCFAIYFTIIQAFVLRAFCPWCLASAFCLYYI